MAARRRKRRKRGFVFCAFCASLRPFLFHSENSGPRGWMRKTFEACRKRCVRRGRRTRHAGARALSPERFARNASLMGGRLVLDERFRRRDADGCGRDDRAPEEAAIGAQRRLYKSAIRNPQSAIRNGMNQLMAMAALAISSSSLVMLAWRSLLYSRVRSLMNCRALSVAFFMATMRALCSLALASRRIW